MAQEKQKKVVRGRSMIPTLLPGDIILIKKQNYSYGDIIVFKKNKKTIIHRIVHLKGNKIIAQGDNMWSTDSIEKKDIIGKAIYNFSQERQIKQHGKIQQQWHKIINKLWRILYGEKNSKKIVTLLKKKTFWYYFYKICM